MKKVKYKITTPFGLRETGEIIDAYVLFESYGVALIFHPADKSRDECGSLEFCRLLKEVYVGTEKNSYINLDSKANKLIKKAFKKA